MPPIEKDNAVLANEPAETSTAGVDKPERAEREPRESVEAKDDKPRSIRDTIKAAVKEHAEPKVGRPRKDVSAGAETSAEREPAVKAPEKAADGKEIPTKETTAAKEVAPEAQPIAPPKALSPAIKATWDKLDPAVRTEFARLEAESAKGVEQLRDRYKVYDTALGPVRDELKMLGKTEAQGIEMLVDWRRALSGPQKVQAFAALARAEGIDLSQLVPRPPNNGQAPQLPPNNDPSQILRPYLDPLVQKITALETDVQRRDRDRVQSDISSFAAGKPHFEKVKVAMGHLMSSGLVTGANAKEAFDEAYARACRMDPEVFAAIQAEEATKREAEARVSQEAAAKKAAEAEETRKRRQAEEVDKARRAGVGPRGGSPMGQATATKPGQSVGDSIRAAVKEVRASI